MVVVNNTKSIKFNEWNKMKSLRIWKASRLLFTDYQIEILTKVMHFEELTKQDKEVFSRTLKPKLNAIIDIQDIALLLRDRI